MPEQTDKIYRFGSLATYSLKQRILIRVADLAFFTLIKTLGALTRFEVKGIEHFEAIEAAEKLPIYAFWHDRVFLSNYYWRNRGIVVLTSQSLDGEYISRTTRRLGSGAIRGSSTRGGAKAMVEMIKAMRLGCPMAFAVDGPRGPRYKAKYGAIVLAKKSGNPVMPFVIEPRKFWTLNSWDKMQIPRPFSTACLLIGEPIYVDADASDDMVNAKLALLQQTLDNLVEEGKKWSGREK